MLHVSILITEEIQDVNQLYRHLSAMDTNGFQIQLLLIQHRKLLDAHMQVLQSLAGFVVDQMIYPEDEDLLFDDVLQNIHAEYMIYLFPHQKYPSDFLLRIFRVPKEEKVQIATDRAPYMERLLKAVQQSKYGMGVLKKDIKREYPELIWSCAYPLAAYKKHQFLHLELDDHIAEKWGQLAKRKDLEAKTYSPDYADIVYFDSVKEYRSAVKKEAQTWAFRKRPDSTGLPFYMVLFMVVCILISPFLLIAIFPLLIVFTLYLLTITLESLAISTMKRQNDLLPGMLVFFPLLHMYYLWTSLVRN